MTASGDRLPRPMTSAAMPEPRPNRFIGPVQRQRGKQAEEDDVADAAGGDDRQQERVEHLFDHRVCDCKVQNADADHQNDGGACVGNAVARV